MPIENNLQFEQASIYSDLGSLNSIREQGLSDKHGAIKKAAKEFEAFFMNMMLKSMRQASEGIGKNDLTGSSEEKMFTGMMDEQMAADLSQKGHLGIADLMLSQLSKLQGVDNNDGKKNNNYAQVKNITDVNAQNLNSSQLNKYRVTPVSITPAPITTAPITQPPVEGPNKPVIKDVIQPIIISDESITKVSVKDNTDNMELINEAKELNKTVTPEKKSLFNEVSEFVSTLLPFAKQAADKISVDPRVLIAQAALETGWGKFIMHDESGKPGFNLFGIKAGKSWQGGSIKINTLEVENQEFKKVNAEFRKYEGFSQSFDDYVSFLKQNPRYQKALEATGDAKEYVKQLQASGYATDPNYANKIMSIFEEDKLQKISL